MFNIILPMVIFVVVALCLKKKLIIRFDTFFRRGFKKYSDKYRRGVLRTANRVIGKSYSAIDYIHEIRGQKKVITNQYKYYLLNKDFCIYEPNFYQIIAKFNDGIYDKDYIIFYDELFTLLEKGKLSKNILTFISQLRKREIYLVTTVQEWLDINVTFRRYVRYQIDCTMFNFLGFFAISINSIHDGYQMKWDNIENEYVAPIIKTTIKKCSKKLADSYDTFEVIKISE